MTADDAREMAKKRMEESRAQAEQRQKEFLDASREKYREILDRIYTVINNNVTEYGIRFGLDNINSDGAEGIISVLQADGFHVDIEADRSNNQMG